jgi:hypothetical protein
LNAWGARGSVGQDAIHRSLEFRRPLAEIEVQRDPGGGDGAVQAVAEDGVGPAHLLEPDEPRPDPGELGPGLRAKEEPRQPGGQEEGGWGVGSHVRRRRRIHRWFG